MMNQNFKEGEGAKIATADQSHTQLYNSKKKASMPAIKTEVAARVSSSALPVAEDVSTVPGVLVGLDDGRRLGSGRGEEVGAAEGTGVGTGTESVVATGPRCKATAKEASWRVEDSCVVLKVHVNPPAVELVREPIAGA